MNIKELKKIIADMPDDAPVLLSSHYHTHNKASVYDTVAIFRKDGRLYEEFAGDWQLQEPGTEKIVALCLY